MSEADDRVAAAAAAAGLQISIQRFPEGTRTAEDAARAVGCDVAQIVKSLVFVADGQPVIAL
ncbi:MAG: YbaK/EbsC family protein, partial [Candidatus Rokuibacteriota bacterium]